MVCENLVYKASDFPSLPKREIIIVKWKIAQALIIRLFFLSLILSSCSLFNQADPEAENSTDVNKNPFAEGVLKGVAHLAPKDSVSVFLANVADQLGWESDVAKNGLIKKAANDGDFDEKVEPYLLALFFSRGFSVLPNIGEGHELSGDSLIRGKVLDVKFNITTRQPVRLIFLQPMERIQIIYPMDGVQPIIFAQNPEGVMIVRRSHLEQYLR